MLTSTILNVVRFAGRYVTMMEYLPHIAFGMQGSFLGILLIRFPLASPLALA